MVGKDLTYNSHEMTKKYNSAKILERCPTGKVDTCTF